MTIGTGIAIAGIWLGVGLIGFKSDEAAAMAAFYAIFPTVMIAMFSAL